MTRIFALSAAIMLVCAGGQAADARKKQQPPPPVPQGTLVENVNGYTLNQAGKLERFNGLLIDDQGKVKRLLRAGDERPYVKFRTDAHGEMLVPGFIAQRSHVMDRGRRLLADARAAAGERQLPDNAVDREAALTKALQYYAARGVTTVEDAGTSVSDWLLFRRFGDEGRLTIRILAQANGTDVLDQVAPLRPTPWLYEGRLAMRSVLLSVVGSDDKTAGGARIRNQISRALMYGIQPVVDAGNADEAAKAIDAYAEMLPTYGKNRHYRLDITQVLDPPQQARAKEMSVVIVGKGSATDVVAIGRSAAEVLVTAVPLTAKAAGVDDLAGTLEPGKWADFVLMRSDAAGGLQVMESWVGGKRVFVAGPANSPDRSASKQ